MTLSVPDVVRFIEMDEVLSVLRPLHLCGLVLASEVLEVFEVASVVMLSEHEVSHVCRSEVDAAVEGIGNTVTVKAVVTVPEWLDV